MSKKKYCLGCGVLLQDENITQEGYVTSLENNICQRCFRMKNYGEYQVVAKSNEEYIEILKSVGKTKDLVLHIVDLVNLDKDIHNIREYLPNKMILVLIDTPGLVDRGNITNYVDSNNLKKLIHKKEMKPKTYQIKKGQCLVIGDICRVDYVDGDRNSFTLYIPNGLKVKKMNANRQTIMKDLSKTTYEMKYREDLVINGLGWIKIVEKGVLDIYIDKNVETFTRRNFI